MKSERETHWLYKNQHRSFEHWEVQSANWLLNNSLGTQNYLRIHADNDLKY